MQQPPLPDPSAAHDDLSIELLRGVAACLVMFSHYQSMAGLDKNLLGFGFTGVDLFFVISGFVFAPYLLGKELKPAGFFVRRLFRIYPLYLVALAAYATYGYAHGKPPDHLLTHLLFLHTTQSAEIAFYYNGAFWSLPPEIEFYLALPLFCLLIPRPHRLPALLACALAMHFTINGLNRAEGAEGWVVLLQFHLPKLLLEFILGAAAKWVALHARSPRMRALSIACGGALWLVLAHLFKTGGNELIDGSGWLRGNMGLFAAMAYALMIIGIAGFRAPGATLWARGAQGCGNLSYGIYLFHNLMPELLNPLRPQVPAALYVLACILAALLTAFLLHHGCERPFRQFGRRLGRSLEHAGAPGPAS